MYVRSNTIVPDVLLSESGQHDSFRNMAGSIPCRWALLVSAVALASNQLERRNTYLSHGVTIGAYRF